MSLLRLRELKPDVPHKPDVPDKYWTVRFTAAFDDGHEDSWEVTYDFIPKDGDYEKAAGDLLLAGWAGQNRAGYVSGNTLYPHHRVEQVTWEIL